MRGTSGGTSTRHRTPPVRSTLQGRPRHRPSPSSTRRTALLPYTSIRRRTRMRKLLRVGLLVASLSGLVATLAPTPADAQTAGAIGFVGTATVGHGIAYPLINNSAPPPPLHLSTSKAAPFIHNSAVIEKFETIVPGCLGAVAST